MNNNAYDRGFEQCRKYAAILMCKRCAEAQFDPAWTVEHKDGQWVHLWEGRIPEPCDAAKMWNIVRPQDPERPE